MGGMHVQSSQAANQLSEKEYGNYCVRELLVAPELAKLGNYTGRWEYQPLNACRSGPGTCQESHASQTIEWQHGVGWKIDGRKE
jgi:hypothetical protein